MSGQKVYWDFLDKITAVKVAPKDTPNFAALTTELYQQVQTNTYSRLRVTTLVLQATTTSHASFHPALAWLREKWPAAPSAGKADAPSPARATPVVLTPSVSHAASASASPSASAPGPASASAKPVVVVPRPSPSPYPSPYPSPSPSASAAASPASAPVVVQRIIRPLLRQCADNSAATVVFSWSQSSMFAHLHLPADTFQGFCAAAVGQWLAVPDGFEALIRKQTGKIDILNLHSNYKGSGKASDEFITATFKSLTFVSASAVAPLTAESIYTKVTPGGKYMIGVLREGGGGHAIGLVSHANKSYSFFDPNEGLATMADATILWKFLWYYVNDKDQGLLTDFSKVFVAKWS